MKLTDVDVEDVSVLPVFESSFTIAEIEQNFDSIDIFSELMKALEEAMVHSKGGNIDEGKNQTGL